jgi:hypothetical protein
MAKTDLTAQRLRELLHYDPETGVFRWLVTKGGRAAGTTAGFKTKGYTQIGVSGKTYLAHRLAFFYVTGEWPTHEIDHINRNSGDNRWANLRPANRAENMQNQGVARDSKTGVKGVTWHTAGKKWCANIRHQGKLHYLGLFDDIAGAAAAYADAAAAYHTRNCSSEQAKQAPSDCAPPAANAQAGA